jgi:hypothetical protein
VRPSRDCRPRPRRLRSDAAPDRPGPSCRTSVLYRGGSRQAPAARRAPSLACRAPVGHFEAAGTLLADLDRILQVVDPLQVVRICRVDQYADSQQDVARADLLPCEGVAARVIDDLRRIHVLIDHLHRHEVVARIRQGDRHGSRIKIKNRRGRANSLSAEILNICPA